MANPVESGSRRGSDDLALRPIKVQPRAKAPAPTPSRRYWIGVTLDAPFDADSRGGVAFQKWGESPEFDDAGRVKNNAPLGTVVELTEAQVRLIKERVENIVIRVGTFTGDRAKAPRKETVLERVFLGSAPKYRPAANDVPLGHYLYMVPVAERMPHDWRSGTPERMVDERSMLKLCGASAPEPAVAAAG